MSNETLHLSSYSALFISYFVFSTLVTFEPLWGIRIQIEDWGRSQVSISKSVDKIFTVSFVSLIFVRLRWVYGFSLLRYSIRIAISLKISTSEYLLFILVRCVIHLRRCGVCRTGLNQGTHGTGAVHVSILCTPDVGIGSKCMEKQSVLCDMVWSR